MSVSLLVVLVATLLVGFYVVKVVNLFSSVVAMILSHLFVCAHMIDSLSRLGHRPLFISATGADSHSDAVFNYCKHMVG